MLSDIVFGVLYYIVKYRRRVVRMNLEKSFPEKSETELRQIERDFYHFLCDYGVESLKLLTIKPEEMMAIGSMNKIKNPIAPKREPSLVILTNRDKTVTITITGRTPFTPPFTIFFPELVFPKSPRVSEPNKAGMR